MAEEKLIKGDREGEGERKDRVGGSEREDPAVNVNMKREKENQPALNAAHKEVVIDLELESSVELGVLLLEELIKLEGGRETVSV